MARPRLRRSPRLERLEAREVLSAGGPGPDAQYLLELINEARANPAVAAQRVTTDLDGDTLATLAFAGEDIQQIGREIAASPARSPLAWNDRLAAAAQAHSQDQADAGVQSHTGSDGSDLATRLDRAGYVGRRSAAENAFGYARSIDQAHWAFLTDVGVPSRAHRRHILQPDPSEAPSREVGLGIAESRRFGFGPKVVTEVFGRRDDAPAQLLGVAFDDPNGNRRYDLGEGRGGVAIEAVPLDDAGQPSGPGAATTSWGAGGYQIPLDPGFYEVTARVGPRVVRRQRLRIGTENVKVDYNLSDAWEPTDPVVVVPAPPPVEVTEPAPSPPPVVVDPPAPAPPPVVVDEPTPAPVPVVVDVPRPAPVPVVVNAPEPAPPRIEVVVPAIKAPRVPDTTPEPEVTIPPVTAPTTESPAPQPDVEPQGAGHPTETPAPETPFGKLRWITNWTSWTATTAR
jgi:Cysteine-rich secretory protein family